MRPIWRFVKQELVATLFIVGGVVMFVYDAVSGVLQLQEWGIPSWGWQIISALLMGLGLLVLAYRLHRRVEAVETNSMQFTQKPPARNVFRPPQTLSDATIVGSKPVTLDMEGTQKVAENMGSANIRNIIKDWSRPSSFELFQAGVLWANEVPPANALFPISNSARANIEMLKAAVISGEIPASEVKKHFQFLEVDERTRLTRKGLFEFADSRREYPAFLFPDGPGTGLV